MRRLVLSAGVLAALVLTAASAGAAPVAAGVQPGVATQAAVQAHTAAAHSAPCNVSIPVIGGVVSTITNAACGLGNDVASGVGDVVSGIGSGILDLVANWLIGAATAITRFVAAQMAATTTPQLESSWYAAQFAPMAALGGGLALMVALISFGSAALRRSPDALAATVAGTVRAGLGTGMVVALTAIALGVADQISADVISGSPHAFWNTVAAAWSHSGFGGFGSSALAALIALVEVIGALFVWLELIVRNAAIYIAVLFFPVALAASIWPPLAGWTSRLGRLLLLLVILKPVTLIVLALAGNAAAAGLSFGTGVPGSVGTILAAIVIFALAAFAPWTLMYLLAADAEGAWTAGALRTGAGQAVGGQSGQSVRTGGGLARLSGRGSSGGPGANGEAAGGPGGSPGSNGNGGGGGGDGPRPGSPALPSSNGSPAGGSSTGSDRRAVGGGAVAAAAGIQSPGGNSAATAVSPGGGGQGSPAGERTRAPSGRSQGGSAGGEPRGAGAFDRSGSPGRDRAAGVSSEPVGSAAGASPRPAATSRETRRGPTSRGHNQPDVKGRGRETPARDGGSPPPGPVRKPPPPARPGR